MRSAFSWFSEFCHSRRLSHFAASFIVTRAEASIAENCDRIRKSENTKKNSRKVLCEVITWHPVTVAYKMLPLPVAHEYNSALRLSWTHSKIQVWKWIYLSCKWSFRRFTYGNLVTTSPSSKWQGLLDFIAKSMPGQRMQLQIIHRTTQSVGATGGVYKGQGRNQRELMTRTY